MQDFKNKNFKEVKDFLEKRGINYRVYYIITDKVDVGNVCSQSIPAGKRINVKDTFKANQELNLTVSKGREHFRLPNFLGDNYKEAQKLLEDKYDLNVYLNKEKYTLKDDKDCILEMHPKAGTEVKHGDSVYLTISKGRNLGPIPDVVGMNMYKAIDRINSEGFLTETRIPKNYKGREKELLILSMEPKALTKNYRGTVVLNAGTYEDYDRLFHK